MNAIGPMKTALLIDESKKIFKVSRQAFVDPVIPVRSGAEASCSPATAREISTRC